jgi:hypothetical protein
MTKIAKFFFHPGPWFFAAGGSCLVGGDYFTAVLLFVAGLAWM